MRSGVATRPSARTMLVTDTLYTASRVTSRRRRWARGVRDSLSDWGACYTAPSRTSSGRVAGGGGTRNRGASTRAVVAGIVLRAGVAIVAPRSHRGSSAGSRGRRAGGTSRTRVPRIPPMSAAIAGLGLGTAAPLVARGAFACAADGGAAQVQTILRVGRSAGSGVARAGGLVGLAVATG